jgi:apolipoprotein N-acyltransferase
LKKKEISILEKRMYYILSLIGGILLGLVWLDFDLTYLLFIALVPLLWVEDMISNKVLKRSWLQVFIISSVCFLTWNVIATWWIGQITIIGAIGVIGLSTLYLALVIVLFHSIKLKLGNVLGYLFLIFGWTAFEYYFQNGELYYSWLNLGAGLAGNINFIQWYEYTGVLGGTIWVLTANVLLFLMLKAFMNVSRKQNVFLFISSLVVIAVPVYLSGIIFQRPGKSDHSVKFALVQPNIDPFSEKFGGLSPQEQLHKILILANLKADTTIDCFIGPETALIDSIYEDSLNTNNSIIEIRKFLLKYPKATFIIGATTYKQYSKAEVPSYTARLNPKNGMFFDVYNTALQIDTSQTISTYHKSKLVIGIEKIPYGENLRFLNNTTINIGGIFGSLGVQKERSVFALPNKVVAAPIICYESAYGEYVTDYAKKGANIFILITNDGWLDQTPGYMQHLRFAQLRAIENRRSIARCGNTGISAFINEKGAINESSEWWMPSTLVGTLRINNELTFYSTYGDYLGKFSVILVGLIALVYAVFLLKRY